MMSPPSNNALHVMDDDSMACFGSPFRLSLPSSLPATPQPFDPIMPIPTLSFEVQSPSIGALVMQQLSPVDEEMISTVIIHSEATTANISPHPVPHHYEHETQSHCVVQNSSVLVRSDLIDRSIYAPAFSDMAVSPSSYHLVRQQQQQEQSMNENQFEQSQQEQHQHQCTHGHSQQQHQYTYIDTTMCDTIPASSSPNPFRRSSIFHSSEQNIELQRRTEQHHHPDSKLPLHLASFSSEESLFVSTSMVISPSGRNDFAGSCSLQLSASHQTTLQDDTNMFLDLSPSPTNQQHQRQPSHHLSFSSTSLSTSSTPNYSMTPTSTVTPQAPIPHAIDQQQFHRSIEHSAVPQMPSLSLYLQQEQRQHPYLSYSYVEDVDGVGRGDHSISHSYSDEVRPIGLHPITSEPIYQAIPLMIECISTTSTPSSHPSTLSHTPLITPPPSPRSYQHESPPRAALEFDSQPVKTSTMSLASDWNRPKAAAGLRISLPHRVTKVRDEACVEATPLHPINPSNAQPTTVMPVSVLHDLNPTPMSLVTSGTSSLVHAADVFRAASIANACGPDGKQMPSKENAVVHGASSITQTSRTTRQRKPTKRFSQDAYSSSPVAASNKGHDNEHSEDDDGDNDDDDDDDDPSSDDGHYSKGEGECDSDYMDDKPTSSLRTRRSKRQPTRSQIASSSSNHLAVPSISASTSPSSVLSTSPSTSSQPAFTYRPNYNKCCPWPGCSARFPKDSTLARHIRCHTGEKPFRCTFPHCTASFSERGNLVRHAASHTDDRRFVCPFGGYCHARFRRAAHVEQHVASKHTARGEDVTRAYLYTAPPPDPMKRGPKGTHARRGRPGRFVRPPKPPRVKKREGEQQSSMTRDGMTASENVPIANSDANSMSSMISSSNPADDSLPPLPVVYDRVTRGRPKRSSNPTMHTVSNSNLSSTLSISEPANPALMANMKFADLKGTIIPAGTSLHSSSMTAHQFHSGTISHAHSHQLRSTRRAK